MSTYLAMKYAAPSGFIRGLFHRITRVRLLTAYPHSGIVRDGMLMHTNLDNGLHIVPFDPAGWELYEIPSHPKHDDLFDQYEGTKYDWFSLLAFVLPWNVRDGSRMYCYEWSWLYMTGQNPNERITPEMLLAQAYRSIR